MKNQPMLTSNRLLTPLIALLTLILFGRVLDTKAFAKDEQDRPMNVLFIIADDLRPELGCYGHPLIKSPNIDRLAASGTVFTQAYCNVPVCGASRSSFLTGLRPTRSRFVNWNTRMDADAPEADTIASHFKRSGYQSISLGKIAHFPDDQKHHWTESPWRPDYPDNDKVQVTWRDYQSPKNIEISQSNPNGAGPPLEAGDVGDDAYRDGQIATKAVQRLKELAKSDDPFFLAVGFLKPHLPFNAPKKYWDLYDRDEIHLPDNYRRPENVPNVAMRSSGELRAYTGLPRMGLVEDQKAIELIHGYYACVSYVDAQVGRVLDQLHQSGLGDRTVVILCGDHGWNLGDHQLWCKHCNFQSSLRTAFVARRPGQSAGQTCDAMIELVDLFPTMCELTSLAAPAGLQGTSFAKLLDGDPADRKKHVVCLWKSGQTALDARYSYTQWTNRQGDEAARMLYDHESDPGENVNVAEHPEQRDVISRMQAILRESE